MDEQIAYHPDSTPEDLTDNDKLAEFDYTVRADGKRTQAIETFWFDSDGTPSTLEAHINQIDWTYDDAGRLIYEVFNHYEDLLDQTEHFTYDLTGNRLEMCPSKLWSHSLPNSRCRDFGLLTVVLPNCCEFWRGGARWFWSIGISLPWGDGFG